MAQTFADVKELIHLRQRAVHHDRVGGLNSDVAVFADGNPHRCRHQRGAVVDAVTQVDGFGRTRLALNDGQLFFGTLLREHLTDPRVSRQILRFGQPVAGQQDHAGKIVFGTQVTDERFQVLARLVAESNGGCIRFIDQNDAFQAPAHWRKVREHF